MCYENLNKENYETIYFYVTPVGTWFGGGGKEGGKEGRIHVTGYT